MASRVEVISLAATLRLSSNGRRKQRERAETGQWTCQRKCCRHDVFGNAHAFSLPSYRLAPGGRMPTIRKRTLNLSEGRRSAAESEGILASAAPFG